MLNSTALSGGQANMIKFKNGSKIDQSCWGCKQLEGREDFFKNKDS